MASVWKRLQRVNKRAAKFQYTASYHSIELETSPKWKPNKLSVVWTRRSRRVVTEPLEWEPSLKDPLKGSVVYSVPENQTVTVTLFKDSRTNELEDKDWTFVLEDVSVTGKRRRLAVASINMRKYASLEPSARAVCVPLDPTTHKVAAAAIHLTLHCVLLREGQATDEDMQSLASLLSVNNNSDIAVLEDLEEDDTYTLSDHSTRQMFDLRQQMEEMTQSLTSSDIAATPSSVQSLKFDSRGSTTPTAHTPTTPTPRDEEVLPVAPTPTKPTPRDEEVLPPAPAPTKPTPPEDEVLSTALTPRDQEVQFTPNFDIKKVELKSSTPIETIDNFKEMVFKPKTIAKRNLKPLELKTNLNIALDRNDNEKDEDVDKTPTADMEKLFPGKFDKDKTPVQDLLEWCQYITREYKSCKITNLTTSFRSGLAFCAIIHHYRPDLIDFSGLQPEQAERNVRCALEASAALGISQVLTAGDVCAPPTPDRLAIMTYLFQLRAHFTGSELQVEQLGNDETESSYLVGRHDTDGALPRDLFSREVATRRSRNTIDRPRPSSMESAPTAPVVPAGPNRRRSPEGALRGILTRVLPPSTQPAPTAHWFTDTEPIPARPEKLMTRKELTDPFGSDEEDEEKNPPLPASDLTTVKPESKPPTIEPAATDPLTTPPEPTYNQLIKQPTDPQPTDPQPNEKINEGNSKPTERQPSDPPTTQPLETRNQAPEKPVQPKPTTPELPKPTPQLLSRHDELKERARQLLEATKREAREKDRLKKQSSKEKEEKENGLRNGDLSPKKPMTEEERQAMLRERARKLIADARAGIVSPTSPLSPSRAPGRPTLEIISRSSVMEELAAAGGMEQLDALLARECSTPNSRSSLSPDRSEGRNSEDSKSVKSAGSVEERRSPLHSFSALVDRLTPDKDNDERGESGSYIQSELEALEREQRAIDERAAALEKLLRAVMDKADNTEEEAHLMSQWFNLVNKKNALLRRQMQLNILEQEEDLSRRCELLARELRLSLGVDEWRKTPGQKRRERLLLQELLSAVNERDRLVQEMDEQERAIADDDAIERNLSQVEIQRKNNCILQ